MIIDGHVHIWDPGYIPDPIRFSFARQAAYRRYPFREPEKIFPYVSTSVSDPDGNYLVDDMKLAGIDAVVTMLVDYSVLAGGEAKIPLIKVLAHYGNLQEKYKGKLYAVASIDPRREDAMQLFTTCIKEWHLKGLKLYTACGFSPSDDICNPFYEKCIEWGLPVVFHTSPLSIPMIQRYAHPLLINDVQARYPDLPIVLAHAGKGPWWKDAVAIAMAHPHTYLELSQWGEEAVQNPEQFISKLAYMRDRVGAHKIIFASDYCAGPGINGRESFWPKWVGIIRSLPEIASRYGYSFSPEEAQLILGENAARVYGISIRG